MCEPKISPLNRYRPTVGRLSTRNSRIFSASFQGPAPAIDYPNRTGNLDLLRRHYTVGQLAALSDALITLDKTDLSSWFDFFVTGLGVPHATFYRLCRYSPKALQDSSPYAAGAAIVLMRGLGISQQEIVDRILPCYPGLLTLTIEQRDSALEALASCGEDTQAASEWVRSCPSFLLAEVNGDLVPLLERIRISRMGK